jgi:phosphoribosylcarboxyaminoimidazole (NCAIR) mutase
VKPSHAGKRPVLILCVSPSPATSSTLAIPPVIAPPLTLSALVHVAKALTLPLTSNVQSPAGITIPAFATDAADRTAPATAKLILLFRKIS